MRQIEFGGFEWDLKNSEGRVGPGPNVFSDTEDLVRVEDGKLHLGIKQVGRVWKCSEAVLARPLGFGTYTFTVETPFTPFEKPAVFGAFLYENDEQEIDVEVSPAMVGKQKGQFVVQPGRRRENLHKFPLVTSGPTTYSITWLPDQIACRVWNETSLIVDWKYPGPGIVSPEYARFIFNLWLYRGKKPKNTQEVVVSTFSFTATQ